MPINKSLFKSRGLFYLKKEKKQNFKKEGGGSAGKNGELLMRQYSQ